MSLNNSIQYFDIVFFLSLYYLINKSFNLIFFS